MLLFLATEAIKGRLCRNAGLGHGADSQMRDSVGDPVAGAKHGGSQVLGQQSLA